MPVSYPYVIPAFFAPFIEKHGRAPVAIDLTPEERQHAAACIATNLVSAYVHGETYEPDLVLMQCVNENLREVPDLTALFDRHRKPLDLRELEAKRDLIRKSLHTAWGQSKASPEYQKCWWRVIATVLENITCSTDPIAIKFLTDLSLPSDPERPT